MACRQSRRKWWQWAALPLFVSLPCTTHNATYPQRALAQLMSESERVFVMVVRHAFMHRAAFIKPLGTLASIGIAVHMWERFQETPEQRRALRKIQKEHKDKEKENQRTDVYALKIYLSAGLATPLISIASALLAGAAQRHTHIKLEAYSANVLIAIAATISPVILNPYLAYRHLKNVGNLHQINRFNAASFLGGAIIAWSFAAFVCSGEAPEY